MEINRHSPHTPPSHAQGQVFSTYYYSFFFTDVKVSLFPYVMDVVLKGDDTGKKRDGRILHKNLYFNNN